MYHDQVLAPFKALFGFDAINITLGLKYLRISPDHGTAQDIIGLNKANPHSLITAIKFLKKFND
jgi:4-hydroxythreonine-4-phosphate dehydrogenase